MALPHLVLCSCLNCVICPATNLSVKSNSDSNYWGPGQPALVPDLPLWQGGWELHDSGSPFQPKPFYNPTIPEPSDDSDSPQCTPAFPPVLHIPWPWLLQNRLGAALQDPGWSEHSFSHIPALKWYIGHFQYKPATTQISPITHLHKTHLKMCYEPKAIH